MNIVKPLALRQLAALFLLGSSLAAGAAEIPAASTEASKGSNEVASLPQPIATATESNGAAQPEACHFGMCNQPRFDEPKNDVLIGSELLPAQGLRALLNANEGDTGC